MADKNNTLVPRMESIILTSRALAGLSLLPCIKRRAHHKATQLRSTCHSKQRKQAIRDRQVHLFHQTNAPVLRLPTMLSKALSRKHTTLIACSASPRPQRAMLWITQKADWFASNKYTYALDVQRANHIHNTLGARVAAR